jgi:hypothetical protein
MIRLAILRALSTIEAAAVATLGACVLVRGFILDAPQPKRDPFTGRPEDSRPN